MKRQDVESSMLASIGYDEKSKTLEVEFNHGGVYRYKKVSKKVYEELTNADSIGSYFYHNIRDDYDYIQVGRH